MEESWEHSDWTQASPNQTCYAHKYFSQIFFLFVCFRGEPCCNPVGVMELSGLCLMHCRIKYIIYLSGCIYWVLYLAVISSIHILKWYETHYYVVVHSYADILKCLLMCNIRQLLLWRHRLQIFHYLFSHKPHGCTQEELQLLTTLLNTYICLCPHYSAL